MFISRPPNRRPILYVPGLLSLALLLPLCWKTINEANLFKKYRTMEVVWYDDKMQKEHPLPARNYTDIRLNGDATADAIKLDYSKILIREMISVGDTINAVRIHFADTSKYDSFVRALNICDAERGLNYAVSLDAITVFNQIPYPEGEREIRMLFGSCIVLDRRETPVANAMVYPFEYDFNKNDGKFAVAFLALVLFIIIIRRQTVKYYES
jgi:hypothetical protein